MGAFGLVWYVTLAHKLPTSGVIDAIDPNTRPHLLARLETN
jgi:hypothetical protein